MSQTLAEKVEALRSLLPMIEVHLAFMDGSPGASAYGYSDGEDGEEGATPPVCYGNCHLCKGCAGEAWEALYRGLRRDYPILADIEILLDELMYVDARWRCGVYYTLVQPWDEYDRTKRLGWCQAGLEWLVEELRTASRGKTSRHGYIPTYVPRLELNHRRRVDPAKVRDAKIVQMRVNKNASYHKIASTLRCSKSTVRAVLAGMSVRQGRTVAR